MTKTEAAMKWLEEEYGIRSEAELDKALSKTRLNIGIFVSPIPDLALKGAISDDKETRPA